MTRTIFRNLEGEWVIKRNLGAVGNAQGKAQFVKSKDNDHVLCYTEKLDVMLVRGGIQSGAHQEYRFVYDEARDSIEKYTSSEELMYKLNISAGCASGAYQCKQDHYIAQYNFLNENHFTLTYSVKGPDKNYVITTEFERISDYVQDASGESSETVDFD